MTSLKARPSKMRFHQLFERDLAGMDSPGVAADIASADLKNAALFDADVYYGVDMDLEALMAGRERHSDDPTKTAILADMRDPVFDVDSLDLIVSSHSLSHLPKSDHRTVVEQFCQYLRPGGTLLLQIHYYSSEIQNFLNSEFGEVESVAYSNRLSQAFERFLADEEGQVVFHQPNRGTNLLRNIGRVAGSLALYAVERTGVLGGTYRYLRCTNKQ